MSRTAYLQVNDDGTDWIAPSCWSCADGFGRLGYEIVRFKADDLYDGQLPLSRDTIVHGWVSCVRGALKQIGAKEPTTTAWVEPLARFYKRDMWLATMASVRSREKFDPPIHVKPATTHKLFAGTLVRRRDDLLGMTHVDGAEMVLVQEYREFLSEFRFYVLRGSVLGMGHYAGDPMLLPIVDVVREIVETYTASGAPCAWGLDVGVAANGGTTLVEVNDSFALGNYGLHSRKYASMVEARWDELTKDVK